MAQQRQAFDAALVMERWLAALFQSVTARTAASTSADLDQTITESGVAGDDADVHRASPGGTGGIKPRFGGPDGCNAPTCAAAMPL